MPGNDFNEQERVNFASLLDGFEDLIVLPDKVTIYKPDQNIMATSNFTEWRPMPYIVTSFDGAPRTDISSEFKNYTQLSVPVTIQFNKVVAFDMDALELQRALDENRLGEAAKQRLASDINQSILDMVGKYGSLVVVRPNKATGFEDVAEIDALMNEQGIPSWERYLALNTRDYNDIATNLAGKEWHSGDVSKAYKQGFVGTISSFETWKLDLAYSLAASTAATVTINGADQYYVPKGTDLTQPGQRNVDNRFQAINITVGSGTVKVGDCIQITGVNSVHHIRKQDTGNLKTFRITEIVSGSGGTGTVKITPPIISGQGGNESENQYKNVTATPANGAPVGFLNTATRQVNPFWSRDAINLIPGRLEIPTNSGVAVMKGSTSQGVEISLQKFWDINLNSGKFRFDCRYGVEVLNPEMCGIILFYQPIS